MSFWDRISKFSQRRKWRVLEKDAARHRFLYSRSMVVSALRSVMPTPKEVKPEMVLALKENLLFLNEEIAVMREKIEELIADVESGQDHDLRLARDLDDVALTLAKKISEDTVKPQKAQCVGSGDAPAVEPIYLQSGHVLPGFYSTLE